MAHAIELSALDLRYQDFRMKNAAFEGKLLVSISERGIQEPLEGVDTPSGSVLLNGFKRYRCARKLHITMVPYVIVADDEALGIVELLRVSHSRSLALLEQALFIEELRGVHRLCVADIAEQVGRSKGWVSMRLGLLDEMTQTVRAKIFSGAFPLYPYMYTLRQFMRMNRVSKREIEVFVKAVSSKGLSVRDIEHLAHGYFRGPEPLREEIRKGNVALPLRQMRQIGQHPDGCSEFERILLKDLELTQQYMQRVVGKLQHEKRLQSSAFLAQANLLTTGILSRLRAFSSTVRGFHDRTGEA